MMIFSKLFLVILVSLAISACQDRSDPRYILEQYITRIARVTSINVRTTSHNDVTLPTLNQRQYPLPEIRIQALDALKLLNCPALSQSVAYRNSSLGKQMLPSQLYFHEKTLLRLIPDCIASISKKNKQSGITNKLSRLLTRKQDAFHAIEWNLMFANTEFIKQLNHTSVPLPLSGDAGQQGTELALVYLGKLLRDKSLKSPFTISELEGQLQQLSASGYSGQLLFSAIKLSQSLNQVSEILEQRLQQKAICSNGKKSIEADRLANVFQLFYVDVIQTYLADIHRRGNDFQILLNNILSVLPPPPSRAMLNYLHQITSAHHRNSIWYQLEHSIKQHTKTWQKVFHQCQMIPGNN